GAATVTGADSELRVNNGASLTIGEFFNGHLGQGSLTIEDGGLVVAAAVRVGSDADSTGALGVNGVPGAEGVLLTARLSKGAGGAAVEFDGGVLRASADSATFIQG